MKVNSNGYLVLLFIRYSSGPAAVSAIGSFLGLLLAAYFHLTWLEKLAPLFFAAAPLGVVVTLINAILGRLVICPHCGERALLVPNCDSELATPSKFSIQATVTTVVNLSDELFSMVHQALSFDECR